MSAKHLQLEELATRILELVRDAADEPPVEPSPYYWQDNSPLGHDKHLRLIREGKLEGFKDGRRVFARKADVHAYIEAHPVKLKPEVRRGTGGKVSTKDTARRFLKGVGV